MTERDARVRLLDIVRAADRILARSGDVSASLDEDEPLQVWVVWHLQVIGEAAARVPVDITARYPDVDWIALRSLRNRLVHAYFDIDLEIIRQVVARDIPALKTQVEAILDEVGG